MSGEDDSSGWQLTESDPGVFTETLQNLGVNLVVDDLYSLDTDALAHFQPIKALVFLFKWVLGQDEQGGGTGEYDEDFTGFFAHQVVNNACATIAVLNAILNQPKLTMGKQLTELVEFMQDMDAQMRGLALTNSDFLRETHNALSPPHVVNFDALNLPKNKAEDAYHFVVYVPRSGHVYELDGLKKYPVRHGAYTEGGEGWVAKAREVIEARIATYPPGSLEFNLMAMHDDPLPKLYENLASAQASGDAALTADISSRIAHEEDKRSRWAFENSLRRHNHIGLIHALSLALAKAGRLEVATEQSREKVKERRAKARKEGRMDED